MHADKLETGDRPKRGRPRSDTVRVLVLETALKLLQNGDTGALTMENIAARAKVSKATLYRWWSSPSAIAFEAFLGEISQHLTWKRSGTLRETLLYQVTLLCELFASTTFGCTIRRVIADAQSNQELSQAFIDNFIMPRREAGKEVLRDMQKSGELRADVNLDVLLDLVLDPIYLRLMTRHAPIDAAFARGLVDMVLEGVVPR